MRQTMTATVGHQGGAGDAFETIRYQDCDLKIEPIAMSANVEMGQPLTLQLIPATKIEPEFQAGTLVQTGIDAAQTIDNNGGDKYFFCPLCGKAFKEAGNLRRHKDTVHEKLRNFSCQDCGKSFGEAGNLRRHKETVHEKVKNFYCKDCGKAFGEAGNLRRHKETVHERVKNYACHCGKTFAERGNLKRHADTVHVTNASGASGATSGTLGSVKKIAIAGSASPSSTNATPESSSLSPALPISSSPLFSTTTPFPVLSTSSPPLPSPLPTSIAYQNASQQTTINHQALTAATRQLQPIHESDSSSDQSAQFCTVTTIIPVVTCIPTNIHPNIHHLSGHHQPDQSSLVGQQLTQQFHLQPLTTTTQHHQASDQANHIVCVDTLENPV